MPGSNTSEKLDNYDLAQISNNTMDLENLENRIRDQFMELTSNWTQKVDFHDGVRSLPVYEAQWLYVTAAAIISIISVCALASLFWGWWELGRQVSLNPLEIALAFNSSILEEVNSNSRRSQIVRVVGPQKVIYSAAKAVEKNQEGEGEREEEEEEHSHEEISFDRELLRPRLKFNHIDDERIEHGDDDDDVPTTTTTTTAPPRPGDIFG